jgi:DNA-binding YbaB/EbfC family protein
MLPNGAAKRLEAKLSHREPTKPCSSLPFEGEITLFKGISNLASMMKQAQQMGTKMKEVNEKLKGERVTATAGAGMVEVEANGLGEVIRVTIEQDLIEKGERDMIESLLPAAINQVVAKAKQLHMDLMTDGMDMPGLDQALAQFTSGDEGGNEA